MIDRYGQITVATSCAAGQPGPPTIGQSAAYVDAYLPKYSGQGYLPHVTVGIGHENYAKRCMIDAPFSRFTFSREPLQLLTWRQEHRLEEFVDLEPVGHRNRAINGACILFDKCRGELVS